MSKLREYLARKGETHAAFAKRIGVAQSYVSDLTNDMKSPSLRVAVAIEDATRGEVKARSWVDAEREKSSGTGKD